MFVLRNSTYIEQMELGIEKAPQQRPLPTTIIFTVPFSLGIFLFSRIIFPS